MSQDDRKRAVGKVISVAADRFVVEMHAGTDNFTIVGFDDVHYVARLGSFLMIPTQSAPGSWQRIGGGSPPRGRLANRPDPE